MKKLLISLFVCLSVVFISCSRPADNLQKENVPVGEHVFSSAEIAYILATNEITATFLLNDQEYVAPTKEWVEKQYTDKLTKFLFDYNLNHWTKESSDCDDIARAAAVQAAILFHNSENRRKGAGFLFGEFYYFKTGYGGHAMNIALVKDKNTYKLVYYEPQLKYLVDISGMERRATIWGRF